MMINEVIQKFLEFDEDVKDEAWATEMVRVVLANSKYIISKSDYDERERVLFGQFPDSELDKLFKGNQMKRVQEKFAKNNTVYFFEKVRNALIDDRASAGLTITVNSLDPEKEEKRKSDRELLQNRKGIEGMLNEITANNGMPPQTISKDDFHGNVEVFDEMGYDEFDPTDLNNFFDAHWGLKQELFLQAPLNAVFRANQFSRNYDKYINDILNCLHTVSHVQVDEVEGAIKIGHIYPYEPEVLHSLGSNDFKSAQAINIRKRTNVRGILKMFGDSFDFEKNWEVLLMASHGGNAAHGYTGISIDETLVWGTMGTLIPFDVLLDAPINYGYCEWKTMNEVVKQKGVNEHGNIVTMHVNKNNPEIDGWDKSSKRSEDTYRAYYLETYSNNPKLIKWGKLYMMETEGQHDEYSGFSIKINTRKGVPIAEILKPFWRMMQVTFKMFEMLVNDVKPDGFIYNYSTLARLAEHLKTAKDTPDTAEEALDNFLKMTEESPNIITDTPKGDEDEVLGGGQFGVQPRKNGLNATAKDLREIMDWIEDKAEKYLGTQGIELTEPRDGFKLSIENKKRTRAATAFIDFILLNHTEDISITVLNYIQDISKFKDIPAYKHLANMAGYKAMDFIASMKKSPHRYGTFLDTFNNDIDLMEIKAMVQQAMANKEIGLVEGLLVRKIDNPNQAIASLIRQKSKAEKKRQMDAMTVLQQQDALAEKAFQRQLAIDNNKGKWQVAVKKMEATGFSDAAAFNAKASITKTQIEQQNENKRVADKAINEIDLQNEKYNKEAQNPVV